MHNESVLPTVLGFRECDGSEQSLSQCALVKGGCDGEAAGTCTPQIPGPACYNGAAPSEGCDVGCTHKIGELDPSPHAIMIVHP